MAKEGGGAGRSGGGSGSLSDSDKATIVNSWGTTSAMRYGSGLSGEEKRSFYNALNRASNGFGGKVTDSMIRAAATHISKAFNSYLSKYSGTDLLGNKYSVGDRIYWSSGKIYLAATIDKLKG